MLHILHYVLLFCLSKTFAQIAVIDDSEGPLDDPIVTPSNLRLQKRCEDALGLESGDVSDDNLAVSSTVPVMNYGKEQARLNGARAWVTYALPNQWIQIDLGKQMYISGVKTQGKLIPRFGAKLWATAYTVLYKLYPRQAAWLAVSYVGGAPLIFDGNSDAVSVSTNYFQHPVQAELIRIVPTSWPEGTGHLALRLELMGCKVEGQSGCRSPRIMTNPSGYIFSMNYPNNYNNNANCRWDLTAPEDQVVILEFAEDFHLEGTQNNCKLDYVEVIDIIGNTEITFGKFCGSTYPGKFSSSYHRMKIHFLADHYENYSGFKATYSFVNGSKCGGPRILHGLNGTFHSMNYPGNYNNFADCAWDIYTDSDKFIEINFSEVRIRGMPGTCIGDSLQISNIGSSPSNDRTVHRICGITQPPVYLSSSSQIRVVFTSNNELTDQGFEATYHSVFSSGCGGKRDLNGPRGTISSLNYPFSYPNGLRCEWIITAGPEEDIKIRFLNFDLEEHSDCQYDHVSIYDGKSERHLLGKYCNKLSIQPLVAHSGAMKIIFESDKYNARSGFEASYVTISRTMQSRTITAVASYHLTDTTHRAESFSPITFAKVLQTYSTSTSIKQTQAIAMTTTLRKHQQKLTSAQYHNQKPKHITSSHKSQNGKNPFVTEELAKWILIGLVSVGGLVLVVMVVGVVLCCRQHRQNQAMSAQGSQRNANSGVMQNRAYDFSMASTSQSIRSRQLDTAESSQVSETVSHQDALNEDLNRDSHIYFSIDDYCGRNRQNTTSNQTEQTKPSIHFQRLRKGSDVEIVENVEEPATPGQSEEELDYDDDDVTINDPIESEVRNSDNIAKTSMQKNTSKTKPAFSATKQSAPKEMVENILYETAKNSES